MRAHEWTPETVQRYWNAVAGEDLDQGSFGRLAGPRLLEIIRPFIIGEVIDVGAGSGHFAKMMLDEGYRVGVLEPSPNRAAEIERLIGNHPNFVGAFGPAAQRKFDTLVTSEVYEHVLDSELDRACAAWVALLAPSGHLILTTPCRENLASSLAICPECGTSFHRKQHVRSVDPEELSAKFAKLGVKEAYLGLHDFSPTRERYDLFNNYQRALRHGILRKAIDQALSSQLSALSSQLSALSSQLSALSSQLSALMPQRQSKFSMRLPLSSQHHIRIIASLQWKAAAPRLSMSA